jgi:hypothetical protein
MPEIVKLWGPWVLLTLSIWIGVALTRHFLPKLWNVSTFVFARDRLVKAYPDLQGFFVSLWHAVQTWPSLALGVLVGAYQLGTSPADAWKGLAFGLFAPLLHHLLKILKKPPTLAVMGLWLLAVLGCSAVPLSDIRDANRVIAEILCARENAPRLGLSIEDVRKGYCAADAVLRPFLDRVQTNPDEAVGLATEPPAGTCPKE